MHAGRKWIPWLLPLLVVGLLGLGIRLALRQNSDQTFRLPDGRQFTLQAVTYGTNHVYRTGSPLVRLLAPILPAKIKQRSGLVEQVQQTQTPALILWGSWKGYNSRSNYPGTWATLVDGSGRETELTWPLFIPWTKPTERQTAWKFLNYPRREQELRFRVYQQGNVSKPELAGEIVVPNLSTGAYPQWTPASLPQTVTNENWECTLVGFAPANIQRNYNSVWQEVTPGYAALFKTQVASQPAPEWSPEFVEVADATGNILQPAYRSTESVADYQQLHFSGPLWPSEQAWKLKVGFVKMGSFPSNEVATLENVPVHSAARQVQWTTNLLIQGAQVLEITLKPYYPLSGGPRKIWPNAQIVLTGSGPAGGWHLTLVSLRDQNGQPLFFERGVHTGSGWQFPYKMRNDTKTVTFQIAAQKIRKVEFTAGLRQVD